MKTLIVGCGYLGTALGERLIRSDHEVWALRRDPKALKKLEKKRFKPVIADLSKPGSLKNLPDTDYIVLCQAPGKEDNYEKTYYEATRNLLAALNRGETGTGSKRGTVPSRVLMVSSTSVYSTNDGSWVDENTDPKAGGILNDEAECLLKTEALVLEKAPSIVFRLGGIYGPGRSRVDALKEGRLKASFSDAIVNRIHTEDAVAGIELLLKSGTLGEIYLGVDDYPSTQKEFYEWIYAKLSLPKITAGPIKDAGRISNKRCSNKKIKALGLKLKYPTFREGYEKIMTLHL